MKENNKSIWTRPWQGFAQLFGWFAVLAFAVFCITFGILIVLNEAKRSTDELTQIAALTAVGLTVALMILLALARWLCCWRNWKRLAFAILGVLTLIALFYAVENFRGARAWNQYRKSGEAQGEKFDIPSVAPPAVPDADNYAAQPIWVEEIHGMLGHEKSKTWYGAKIAALGHTNYLSPLDFSLEVPKSGLKDTNSVGNWQLAEKTDLQPWQTYFRTLATLTNHFPVTPESQSPASDVLTALSRFDGVIEQLRAADRLPHARFPICYNDADPAAILLPHLAPMKGCTATLRLRALAELQAAQPEQALADIELMFRNNAAIRIEPFVISHLVHIAIWHIEIQPIWEGLASRCWDNAQLSQLDAQLQKLDFLADYQTAITGERACFVGSMNYLQSHRKEMTSSGYFNFNNEEQGDRPINALLYRAIPRGWFEQNKVRGCQYLSEVGLQVIDSKNRRYSEASAALVERELSRLVQSSAPYDLLARRLMPTISGLAKRFVQAQSMTDLARVGIALERHRLTHGTYPETLAALEPHFIAKLPHDVVNGQPLHYRHTDDGSFILYSVGWNTTDDGGTVVRRRDKTGKESETVDPKQGDWVWRYPAK